MSVNNNNYYHLWSLFLGSYDHRRGIVCDVKMLLFLLSSKKFLDKSFINRSRFIPFPLHVLYLRKSRISPLGFGVACLTLFRLNWRFIRHFKLARWISLASFSDFRKKDFSWNLVLISIFGGKNRTEINVAQRGDWIGASDQLLSIAAKRWRWERFE